MPCASRRGRRDLRARALVVVDAPRPGRRGRTTAARRRRRRPRPRARARRGDAARRCPRASGDEVPARAGVARGCDDGSPRAARGRSSRPACSSRRASPCGSRRWIASPDSARTSSRRLHVRRRAVPCCSPQGRTTLVQSDVVFSSSCSGTHAPPVASNARVSSTAGPAATASGRAMSWHHSASRSRRHAVDDRAASSSGDTSPAKPAEDDAPPTVARPARDGRCAAT